MRNVFIRATTAFFFLSAISSSSLEAEPTILTISGKIASETPIALDLPSLKKLPARTFRANDPWDGAEHSYTGVALKDLLAHAGVRSDAESITLAARNNYSIPILRSDYERYGYLVAYELDGKSLATEPSMQKRAPLMIAIDFRKHPELPVDIYKHQLIWQLVRIVVD